MDGIFLALAFASLNWYVATYATVKPRTYLWGITVLIIMANLDAVLTPTMSFSMLPAFTTIALPWGGEVNALAGPEYIWGTVNHQQHEHHPNGNGRTNLVHGDCKLELIGLYWDQVRLTGQLCGENRIRKLKLNYLEHSVHPP